MKQILGFSLALLCAVGIQAGSNVKERIVEICNEITRDCLGYTFCGTHYPTSFTVKINGQPVPAGSSARIVVTDKAVVRYEYSFAKGMYAGSKEVVFNLDQKTNKHSLRFSWKKDPRIQLSSARVHSVKEIYKKK